MKICHKCMGVESPICECNKKKQDVSSSTETVGYTPSLADHREVITDLLKAIDDNDRWIGKTSTMLLKSSKKAFDFLDKHGV